MNSDLIERLARLADVLAKTGDELDAGDAELVREAIAALTAVGPQGGAEPVAWEGLSAETVELVDAFAAALKTKLRRAEIKYGYEVGWRADNWETGCRRDLSSHVLKGDPLDVGAYAAFCWFHHWSTAPASPPSPAIEVLDAAAYYIDRLRTAHSGKLVRDLEEAGVAYYRLAGEARAALKSLEKK